MTEAETLADGAAAKIDADQASWPADGAALVQMVARKEKISDAAVMRGGGTRRSGPD